MSITPIESTFLHYFDTHFSDFFLRKHNRELIAQEAELALRLAVLASRIVYIPAASYFESVLCRTTVSSFDEIFDTGVIRLVGRARGLVAFAEQKLRTYDPDGYQYNAYSDAITAPELRHPPFATRRGSATADLVMSWESLAGNEYLESKLFGRNQVELPLDFSESFGRVPEMLENRAFTPEYVVPLLGLSGTSSLIGDKVNEFINEQYFNSFTHELSAASVTDMVYFPTYANNNVHPSLPYSKTREALRAAGVLNEIHEAKPIDLLAYRNDPRVISALRDAIESVPRSPNQQQLMISTFNAEDMKSSLNALANIPTGRTNANRFHKAVSVVLSDLFASSFGGVVHEQEINDGRKRIDIVWPNVAKTGFFDWVRGFMSATYIFAECKNYTDDVGNPEIDQLVGRFAPWSTKVGLLVMRGSKKKDVLIKRCRDAYTAQQGLVIPVDDKDLAELVSLRTDSSAPALDGWLHQRAARVML